MARRGGSFGILILVVVMAVVLLLVAKSWRAIAPTALEGGASVPSTLDARGGTEADEALRSSELPRLDEMRESTDAHADRIRDTLDATD